MDGISRSRDVQSAIEITDHAATVSRPRIIGTAFSAIADGTRDNAVKGSVLTMTPTEIVNRIVQIHAAIDPWAAQRMMSEKRR